jgi:hypothetical protein
MRRIRRQGIHRGLERRWNEDVKLEIGEIGCEKERMDVSHCGLCTMVCLILAMSSLRDLPSEEGTTFYTTYLT